MRFEILNAKFNLRFVHHRFTLLTMRDVIMLQVCRQLDALTLLGPEHGSDKALLVLRTLCLLYVVVSAVLQLMHFATRNSLLSAAKSTLCLTFSNFLYPIHRNI